MRELSDSSIGRFDKSFLIHMIKDFFLVLLVVTIIEFALKFGKVYWDYEVNGEQQARDVAAELSDNVVSIMTNAGGPIAARAMYPILEQNWTDLGYEIAIVPSEITVQSIEKGFGYTPEGIPAAGMTDSEHKTAKLNVYATQFCTSCHTDAKVGDALGQIVVNNYLDRDIAMWWDDVKLTLGLAIGKIVLHSILLFLILRSRMEPLLRLRSVVSKLSKAYSNLDHRADVRTADEFGVLARDLNVFLDRISRLVQELDQVLNQVVEVNDDIIKIQVDLRSQIDDVVKNTRGLERSAMINAKQEPRLSNAWFDATKRSVAELDSALAGVNHAPEAEAVLKNLRSVIENAEAQIRNSEQLYGSLAQLGDEAVVLKESMAEMIRLEERMKGIVDTGSRLVRRLRPTGSASAD